MLLQDSQVFDNLRKFCTSPFEILQCSGKSAWRLLQKIANNLDMYLLKEHVTLLKTINFNVRI